MYKVVEPSILPRALRFSAHCRCGWTHWNARRHKLQMRNNELCRTWRHLESSCPSIKSCQPKENRSGHLILVCFGTFNVLCTDYNLKNVWNLWNPQVWHTSPFMWLRQTPPRFRVISHGRKLEHDICCWIGAKRSWRRWWNWAALCNPWPRCQCFLSKFLWRFLFFPHFCLGCFFFGWGGSSFGGKFLKIGSGKTRCIQWFWEFGSCWLPGNFWKSGEDQSDFGGPLLGEVTVSWWGQAIRVP